MDDPASLTGLFLFAEPVSAVEAPDPFSTIVKILLVFVLVVANGFFVAAEFAFVAVRRTRIEALAAEGSKGAARLLEVLDNLSAYLSAAQLGVTLASLGLGALGEPVVEALLGRFMTGLPDYWHHIVSYGIAFAVITSLHIVLGEQAPKLFGLQLAERVAIATALPMEIFYTVFKPFIHLLDWASAKTVRIFGLQADSDHASIYTEEEIRQLIRISEESGHLNKEERRLINRVFEFSETTVKEAMIPRTEIVAIPETCSLEEMAIAFRQHGYSRLPVYRGSLDDIAGVVHSKDVMASLLRPKNFRLERIMQKPRYVVDTARLEDVLRQMQREKFHFGFVVDEHGGVEGIITLENLLEEIVGDISDEHDEEVSEQIHEQPDGSYLLEGGLAVRDLNRRLDLNLPVSEAYTTVAGFLMAQAGELLNEGDSVSFNSHTFRVEKAAKRRILMVKMKKSA
ncbi:MAG TPA: hemolysin family protein [Pyrinomonadaceae bacterium]|jgi:CBS domain containing-hemolysin-like protein|nr:hemolysin family protein [Pyrinomonadaceae bacterium]